MVNIVGCVFLAICLLLLPKDSFLPVARHTWHYFSTVTSAIGLPDDRIELEGNQELLPDRTSPTNIGLYLFSISCAKKMEIINSEEANNRVALTMKTLSIMERRHGFYLNWYKASTGIAMTEWCHGTPISAFLSSIDNAWLAIALIHVKNEYPEQSESASKILGEMDFKFFYDHEQDFFYGGYDDDLKSYTPYHYGILNSETRLVSYVAIKLGQVPKSHLHKLVKVKRDDLLVSCYGSMFEALAVPLFVPEIEESLKWKEEHSKYVKYQIETKVGNFWGMSYSDDTRGTYKEFGIDRLGQYPAHFEGEGVVTPYASFLALQTDPIKSKENIDNLMKVCYGKYGFFGAYRPHTNEKAKCILTLEQGCIMMAIADSCNHNPSKPWLHGLVEKNFP